MIITEAVMDSLPEYAGAWPGPPQMIPGWPCSVIAALEPGRPVRRGFRNMRDHPLPSQRAEPGKPGPDASQGRRTAASHPSRRGKTTRRKRSLNAQRERAG
jgi:hypothetical protein